MLSTAVAIVGCKGDKGELGPQGPNGKNSLTRTSVEAPGGNCATGGTKIETGIDANNNGALEDNEVDATKTKYVCNGATGTANVYYSNWIVVDNSKWVETNRQITPNVSYTDYNSYVSGSGYTVDKYTDTSITYQAEVPTPKVTQEILDKGVVFYYFKDMTAPSNGKIYPYIWTDWNVGVTNRTTDWSDDSYFYVESANEDYDLQKDKLVLKTVFRSSGAYYDAALNRNGQARYYYYYGNASKRIKYDELKPKTNFAIRYVVIPGGVTGKYVGVDFKNYEQVKKMFNIKD